MKHFFSWLWGAPDKNPEESNSIRPILTKVLRSTLLMTLILFITLLIFFGVNRSFVIFTVAIIMGAYYISGCVLGFIFAIPKSFQNNQQQVITPVDKDGKPVASNPRAPNGIRYKDNTSLEEISDWLTKIIIGLSLTQFTHLQDMVHTAAVSINVSLSSALGTGKTGIQLYSFSYALIILYFLAGACSGYLWTRIEFPKILKQKDDDLDLMKITAQRDELIKSLNNPENKAIESGTLAMSGTEVSQGPTAEMMKKILSLTPMGNVGDDMQKGRWGGISTLDNVTMRAEVTNADIAGLFKVRIIVATVDGSALKTAVGIVLHDSFEPMLRVLDPGGANMVFLEVIAYEAFTVGALCNVESEQHYTRLELDLNELANIPAGFKWS